MVNLLQGIPHRCIYLDNILVTGDIITPTHIITPAGALVGQKGASVGM